MTHLRLLNTPTHGVDEVVKALLNAHAYPPGTGKYVSPARLKRHFPPHTSVADITTALAAAETATFVQDNGSGGYQLTAAGHTHARHSVRNSFCVTV